jgi:hypothetical protein
MHESANSRESKEFESKLVSNNADPDSNNLVVTDFKFLLT